jgi:hypothetical protein
MDNHDHIGIKQAQCCKAILAVVRAGVGNAEGSTGKNSMSLFEIKAVLLEI